MLVLSLIYGIRKVNLVTSIDVHAPRIINPSRNSSMLGEPRRINFQLSKLARSLPRSIRQVAHRDLSSRSSSRSHDSFAESCIATSSTNRTCLDGFIYLTIANYNLSFFLN